METTINEILKKAFLGKTVKFHDDGGTDNDSIIEGKVKDVSLEYSGIYFEIIDEEGEITGMLTPDSISITINE
jgi:hypothetical protein